MEAMCGPLPEHVKTKAGREVMAGLEYLDPTVCRIIAFWTILGGFGPLIYILLGPR